MTEIDGWDYAEQVELDEMNHDYQMEREFMIDELENENAKLHQLVAAVLVLRNDPSYKWLDAAVEEVYGKSFTNVARELGIEATNG